MSRWYVIQVVAGTEQKVCRMIRRMLLVEFAGEEDAPDEPQDVLEPQETGAASRPLKDCFVPRYQVERKFHGAYRIVERNLFPGYIIAITRDVDKLNARLAGIPALTRILGSEKAFVPLDPAEQALINAFASEGHRVVRVSRAVAEGDRISVVEGPLTGREGQIGSVNRRKGTCRVSFSAFGRTLEVELGLALVTKSGA